MIHRLSDILVSLCGRLEILHLMLRSELSRILGADLAHIVEIGLVPN